MMYTQQEQRAAIATERLVLLVLAAINFTGVVDFLIIMPLGPQYMRVFNITSAQFGLMISAYAITAGLAGILAGIYLDRMDRKKALLGIYAGFTLATLLCGLDPTRGCCPIRLCSPSLRNIASHVPRGILIS